MESSFKKYVDRKLQVGKVKTRVRDYSGQIKKTASRITSEAVSPTKGRTKYCYLIVV